MKASLYYVFIGLSITSSWGNGHATTYRSLIKELVKRGHEVLFLEQNAPWYEANRDLPNPSYGKTVVYKNIEELKDRFTTEIQRADMVIVGSYVPDGVMVGEWVIKNAGCKTAFYDIDTPVTLSKLHNKDYQYLKPELIPQYDIYLSFTGGPLLKRIERDYGSPRARALYCSVDVDEYFPEEPDELWDLGYLGTYSDDRQPPLEHLMLDAARVWKNGSFIIAGPQYPDNINWSDNVKRIEHLPPAAHRKFYNSQRFTMNITRKFMVNAGYSPSVRLFEAAACATPIISDYWDGLDSIFKIGKEILVSNSPADTLYYLKDMHETEIITIGKNARERILSEHSSAYRAEELEHFTLEIVAA